MNWSIDRRFSRGLFLTPALLGYDKDEEGNLVINPEEAQTVKVIYYLYLNGYAKNRTENGATGRTWHEFLRGRGTNHGLQKNAGSVRMAVTLSVSV